MMESLTDDDALCRSQSPAREYVVTETFSCSTGSKQPTSTEDNTSALEEK
jgi:hypothetical protein